MSEIISCRNLYRKIMTEGEKDIKVDFLVHLPKELSLKVLTYLTGKELSVVCRVSKTWRDIANYNLLWKKVCIRELVFDDVTTERSDVEEEESELEPECKWAHAYHENQRLHYNWAGDRHTWMVLEQDKPFVDVYRKTIAAAYWDELRPTVDIVEMNPNSLNILQTLPLPINCNEKEPIGICINDSALAIELGNLSAIFCYESGKFNYEVLIVPELKTVCPSGKEQEFVDTYLKHTRCWTLCLAGRYIWYQASSIVIIYDRNTKTFQEMNDVLQVVAVEVRGELIVVQCPHSVRVFYVDGKLLYNYSANTNLFYTGLVMSSTSFAFLQSEDFSDPHVVQVELNTWQTNRETQLRVYRIALYKNVMFLLSQDPFTLTSMSQGSTNWSNFIRGTKYIRPGKDFFTVICSRYLFVCPSLARLDMFSLYDVNNGDHLYDTSLGMSSYNLQTVSDSCLVAHTKKMTVNIRSYV